MRISEDESDDPVRRTAKQLRCYYRCVARDEDELCEDCGLCDEHCSCDEDDDDELGLPRF